MLTPCPPYRCLHRHRWKDLEYVTKRIPSYCDRILWKSMPGDPSLQHTALSDQALGYRALGARLQHTALSDQTVGYHAIGYRALGCRALGYHAPGGHALSYHALGRGLLKVALLRHQYSMQLYQPKPLVAVPLVTMPTIEGCPRLLYCGINTACSFISPSPWVPCP